VVSVLLAGGGTAGHVNPLLALAAELRRRDAATSLHVLGTREGLEAELVPRAGLEMTFVPRVPVPRRPTLDLLRVPGRLRAAVRAADEALERSGADVVVGFGGYVAAPAYLAARRRGVPVVVHEANARPGLANRLGARRAAAVAVTFPGTPLPRAVVTGLPLRPEIEQLLVQREEDPDRVRSAARAELGLAEQRRTLLVTGGSLGALSLNRALVAVGAELVAAGAQVLHLTGKGKDAEVRAGAPREHYHVREYLPEMHLAYAAADLVVCRAGAGTVSELAALGLPAVYVPLPIGNGEQRSNAQGVVAAGGGILVEDRDLTPSWLREHVLGLDDAQLEAMAQAAARAGVRDGAARLADLVAGVLV